MNSFNYEKWVGGGILEINSMSDLPTVGSTGTLYITKDLGNMYWYNSKTSTWVVIGSKARYLSTWYCDTGLPATVPSTTSPYLYRSGDYYVVGRVASGTAKNYKPSGSSFVYDPSPVASTTEETNTVVSGNKYLYDGVDWNLVSGEISGSITISDVEGLQETLDSQATSISKMVYTVENVPVTGDPTLIKISEVEGLTSALGIRPELDETTEE